MKLEYSAGGVVYKKDGDQTLILLGQHSQHHKWVFPKGLIGDKVQGESKEIAALREVEEETGIQAKILKPLPPVTYWYQLKGQKIKKTVYYFLMEHLGGDTAKRDFELENVEWLPQEEVEERLSFKSDKKVWKETQRILLTIK